MSRIGRDPIAIPAGVEIKVEDNNVVTVKGPKGTLTQHFNPNMAIAIEDGVLHVTRPNDCLLYTSKNRTDKFIGKRRNAK